MKRNLFLALTLLVSVLLVACSNGNGDSTAVNDWQATVLSDKPKTLIFCSPSIFLKYVRQATGLS